MVQKEKGSNRVGDWKLGRARVIRQHEIWERGQLRKILFCINAKGIWRFLINPFNIIFPFRSLLKINCENTIPPLSSTPEITTLHAESTQKPLNLPHYWPFYKYFIFRCLDGFLTDNTYTSNECDMKHAILDWLQCFRNEFLWFPPSNFKILDHINSKL